LFRKARGPARADWLNLFPAGPWELRFSRSVELRVKPVLVRGSSGFPLSGDWERVLMYMHVDAFDMTKQQTDAEKVILLYSCQKQSCIYQGEDMASRFLVGLEAILECINKVGRVRWNWYEIPVGGFSLADRFCLKWILIKCMIK